MEEDRGLPARRADELRAGIRRLAVLLAAALLTGVAMSVTRAHQRSEQDTAAAASLPHAPALAEAASPGVEPDWSQPAVLSPCPGSGPRVLFPSDMPDRGTGPGAIVWSDSAGCPGGAGVRVAPLAAGSQTPLPSTPPRLSGLLAAAAGPHGRIVLAGAGRILQGRAGGPYQAVSSRAPVAPPLALTTAYLGDVALALAPRGGPPQVQVERFFSNVLGLPHVGRKRSGAPTQDLVVAMDYRSDALAVWVQGASVYAEDLPARRPPGRAQRIGPAGANVRIAALLSDDNRGMVAWEDSRGSRTDVHFDYSRTGVAFGTPTLLESFPTPKGSSRPAAAPSLIRLSTESVMAAWAGAGGGHWVVRAAAVDQHGIGTPSTIAAGTGDALLADLAPGPYGEALLLLSEPQPGASGPLGAARQALLAARGVDAPPDRALFAAPQLVAEPGAVREAALGVDPDTGAAVASWVAEGGAIEYSTHPPG